MKFPHRPFVVVDMNACRDHAIMSRIHGAGLGVLLPAVANYELIKSSAAEGTLFASFREISRRPNVVSFARASYLLRGIEKRTGRLADSLVHRRVTLRLQTLLAELRAGASRDTHRMVGIDAARSHWRQLRDFEGDAATIRGMAALLKSNVSNQEATAIRDALRAGDREPFREAIVRECGGTTGIEDFLRMNGYRRGRASRLARLLSFSAMTLVGFVAVGLRWRVMHGIEQAKPEDLENDGVDLENALIALYGRDFMTKDLDARALYEDLRAIAARLL